MTVIRDCPTQTSWILSYACPTTKIVTFLSATTGLVQIDCSLITLWPQEPTSAPPTTTSSTTTPLPIWTTWPPGAIVPISTSVSKPTPIGSGTNMPCKLWFFFVCISFGKINIGGWYWSFPPGIYPGPLPPPIDWPPGFTLRGNMPRWPTITVRTEIFPFAHLCACTTLRASCGGQKRVVISFGRAVTLQSDTQANTDCSDRPRPYTDILQQTRQ